MSRLFDMLSISLITNSKNIKRVGERRHPCLTPTNTLNHSVSLTSIMTAHLEFLEGGGGWQVQIGTFFESNAASSCQ